MAKDEDDDEKGAAFKDINLEIYFPILFKPGAPPDTICNRCRRRGHYAAGCRRMRRRGRCESAESTNHRNRTPATTSRSNTRRPELMLSIEQFGDLTREFTDFGGTYFYGTETQRQARDWLARTELILEEIDIDEEMKASVGAWQLKGAAETWWDSIATPNWEKSYIWMEFKDLFIEEYMPNPPEDLTEGEGSNTEEGGGAASSSSSSSSGEDEGEAEFYPSSSRIADF